MMYLMLPRSLQFATYLASVVAHLKIDLQGVYRVESSLFRLRCTRQNMYELRLGGFNVRRVRAGLRLEVRC